MKKILYPALSLFCLIAAHSAIAQTSRNVSYSYDAVGNRISRRELPVGTSCRQAAPQRDTLPGVFFTLYPNPTRNTVNIKMESQKDTASAVYSLYDLSGRLLQNSRTTVGAITPVSLYGYGAGTYILKLKRGDMERIWRVVKAD